MDLLNIQFALLIIKIGICVLPGVAGAYLIAMPEETKRSLRNRVCNYLFDVSNAIPYPKFARTLNIIGGLFIGFSLLATWFLLLRGLI